MMDRKFVKRLQKSFEKRGGRFDVAPGAPPEITRAFLEELIGCPDCRAAMLEACNGDDRKDIDIDSVMRDLALSHDH
jgi:hypothetical protein